MNRRLWLLSLLSVTLLSVTLLAACGRVDPNEGFPGFQDSLTASPTVDDGSGSGVAPTDTGGGAEASTGGGAPRASATPDPPASRAAGSTTGGGAATVPARASASATTGPHVSTSPTGTGGIKLPTSSTSPTVKPTTAKPTGGFTLPN